MMIIFILLGILFYAIGKVGAGEFGIPVDDATLVVFSVVISGVICLAGNRDS